MYSALKYQYSLKGLVIMSSYFPMCAYPYSFPGSTNLRRDPSFKIPLFWGHGKLDPLVNVDWGLKSYNYFLSGLMDKKNSKFVQYPRMAHSACPEEQQDVLEFIHKITNPNL